VDRKPADDMSSDVAVADLPAARRDHETLYRRPPVQLPVTDALPAEGTTGSSWFGGLAAGGAYEDGSVHEHGRMHEDDGRSGSEDAAVQRAETPEPKYGPAPPATAGRTSFGFTAGPISPARPAHEPAPPVWNEFAPINPAIPADRYGLPSSPAAPGWSGDETAGPSWPPPHLTPTPLALEPLRHAELPVRSVPMAGNGKDSAAGHRDAPAGHRDAPAGHRDTRAGHRDTGAGRRDAPAGHRDTGSRRHDTGEIGAVSRERAEQPASPRSEAVLPPRTRQSRIVTVGMILLSVIVLGAGTVIGIVYFSGSDKSLGSMLNLGRNTSASTADDRTVTAPLENRTTASFEMLAGVNTVHLSIGELGDDLYRISTPADAGIKPSPVIHKDNVQLQVTRDGDGTGGEIEVVLAAKVNWQLRFSGYAEEQVLNLGGGQVSSVEMVAGMRRAELDLGKPSGTVPVKITGAVDQLILRSPDGCPMRISLGGGAKTAVAGSRTIRDMPAGSTLTPKDWAVQKDNRYDVTTASAMTSLNVENLVQ